MKYFYVFLLSAFMVIPIYPVYAQASTATPSTILKKDATATPGALFRNKLKAFKDQKKALLVEKINENLARINQQRTTQMIKNLDTMSSILSRLNTFVDSLPPTINTTSVKKATDDAKIAIDASRQVVDAQSKKDYTINITSEASIRSDAKLARDNLRLDLQTTRKSVVDAKKAVSDAITLVATSLKGAKNGQQ